MLGTRRFDNLLEPFHIGRVKTRNRMIKTGATMAWADKDGYITEKSKAFYEALARGGVGLIIVEIGIIDYPLGASHVGRIRIDDDRYIPGYRELAQTIHKHGCPTFLQLFHAGIRTSSRLSGLQPIAASAISPSEAEVLLAGREHVEPYDMPRGLTMPEIEEYVDKFVAAAERGQKAGFDGVEILASTDHLINSFLSRAWNKRQDAYGYADLESRARFLVEIIQAIKQRLGQDFPVGVEINGAEYGVDEGITSEESQAFARILERAGADHIQVRAYGYGEYVHLLFPEQIFYPEPPKPLGEKFDGSHNGAGAFVPLAEAVKKAVSIPVIAVGRLSPILGERILREGKADFIAFTRCLMADPELPNKIASGRLEDIAPCIACLRCLGFVAAGQECQCTVNAALGSERDYVIKQAERRKRVVVVGGGPAGMEAARVTALRGHEVILCEREHKLGGLLPLAAVVKGHEIEDLVPLIRYLKTQIDKLGVKIRLGTEVNLSLIEQIKPDVVVLANGGILTVPEIPGVNRRTVVSSANLYHRLKMCLRFLSPMALRWLTRFWMPFGERVVIIGGAIQGCELAEFLVKRGRKVTVVDTAEALGDGVVAQNKMRLFRWLAKKEVTMMAGIKYEEIIDKGITIITKEGKRLTIEADTIVTAMPLTPNIELLKILEGKVAEIYAIGDCSEPRLIIDAIANGYRIANAI